MGLGVCFGVLVTGTHSPTVCQGGRKLGEGVQQGVGRAFSPAHIEYLGIEPHVDVGVTKGDLFWLVIIG